jgi:hypothetical protein
MDRLKHSRSSVFQLSAAKGWKTGKQTQTPQTVRDFRVYER